MMRIGSSHVYQPHEIVPVSGEYEILTATGARTGETVYCTRDHRFPNVNPPGFGFLLAQQKVPQ
jgi:hypothetical protein